MNYAMTVKALQDCYKLYGEKIFKLNLHLHLESFLKIFGNKSIDKNSLLDILMHSNFRNVMFYYSDSDSETEIDCLLSLDMKFPDDISYVITTPNEYWIINKQIGDDSILTPKLMGPLL